MTVIEITSKEELDKILYMELKVVVNFTASWAGPGKAMSPVFKERSETFEDIVFVSVDVDKSRLFIEEYNITSVPAFIAFERGEKKEKIFGPDKEALQAMLESLRVGYE